MDQMNQPMNQFSQNMPGTGGLSDQVIATDFLIATKSAIKNYAAALSETYSPQLRETLQQQLNDAITMHEQITNYMVSKGYYHPQHVNEQLQIDLQTVQTALNMPLQ